jgi:hypothetical protein
MHNRRTQKLMALGFALVALVVSLPAFAADDVPTAPKPLVATLERLGGLLTQLESQLAAVDRPAADRLEDRVAEAGDLVEELLVSLEAPGASPREQAMKLDRALHRLIAVLEGIVAGPDRQAERDQVRTTLGELRAWVDGYIAAATAGMNPREAERLARAAQDMARSLLTRLAETAKKAQDTQPGLTKLSLVVERLNALTARLDALLQRMRSQSGAGQ